MRTLRILEALRRFIDAAIARQNERITARAYHERCIEGTHWMGVLLICLALPSQACVPRQVSRAIDAEVYRCDQALSAAARVGGSDAFDAEVARCHENLARIGAR